MSEAPSPSNTFAGIPLDGSKTSKVLGQNVPPPSDSNPNTPQESPTNGNNPPPSDSSENPTPPPPDSSSSSQTPPPPDSNPPSDSPPPDSNSSPPSNSESSPPPPPPSPPPPDSNSESSPPPPDSGSSKTPPPSNSESSPPPPPPSDSNSTPPPEGDTQSPPTPPPDSSVAKPPPNDQSPSPPPDKASSPPKSPPKESSPPPTKSKAPPPASTLPPSPLPKTPVSPNSPPQSSDSSPAPTSDTRPPANNTPSVPTPPGSKSPHHVPELTPPPTHKDSSSSTPPSKSSGSSTGGVAGATLAGLVIIAFVAIFFVVKKKKKKRANAYPGYFGPPPPNYSGNADGYYYAQHSGPHSQQHTIGMHSNEFHSGPSQLGHGHGSYRAPESGVIAGGLSCFSYEELMGITSGFSRQNVIGEGGFGSVYKGFLADGRAVAVKELKAGSGQGEREFRAEVEIISRVHHRHLVSLVGYCIADSHRLLVYEFVSNSTLEHHLHGEGVPVMEWSKRMKIAVGSARGLAYLHEDCHPKIIHRDIKSANILIDDDYEAQVADFGLAKLSNDISAHVSTRVMGTFGYLAPEYAASGKLSDKSDVFSFGVVLLEIVTGRKPVDGSQPLGDESLVEWARPLLAHALETGDFSELIDPRLENRYVEDEMLRMITAASASVRHSAPKRPRMVQVLRALDVDGEMPDLTNGVKVGQSTIFENGKNVSDMQKFRMMAFGSEDSSEYQMQSGNFTSGEVPLKFTSGEAPRRPRPGDTGAVEFPSGESETRPINPRSNYRL